VVEGVVDKNLKEFIRRMPKVELHLHLEGSIRPQTALELMRRNDPSKAPANSFDVKRIYRFDNLSEFVQGMRNVSDNIRNLDDLQQVTLELFDSLIEQNVQYVEFDCAVQKYIDLGFSLEEIVDALYRCSLEFPVKNRLKSNLIINLQRSHDPAKVSKLVEQVVELDHPYIVGIGLSGDESSYPQSLFVEAFQIAREAGLHRTVHAGEAAGAASVWDALTKLHAERIDHGTRAIDDLKLVRYLQEHDIPLTQCLSSNINLNVVDGYENHPFGEFYKRGLCVTLNTDDPQVFGISLTKEFEIAAKYFSFDSDDLARIVLNGITASFESEQNKLFYHQRIEKELTFLENELQQEYVNEMSSI